MNSFAPILNSRTRFSGHALTWLRAAWIVIFLLTLFAWFRAVQFAHPTWFGYESADEQALEQIGLSIGFASSFQLAMEIFWAVSLFGMGLIVMWKKSTSPYVVFISLAILTLVAGGSAGNILMQSQESLGWILRFMDGLGMTIAFIALFTFPTGTCIPKWSRWMVVAAVLVGSVNFLLHIFRAALNSDVFWDVIVTMQSVCAVVFLAFGVYAQARRYRSESTPLQRKQIRYLVFGFILAVAGFVSINLWFMVIAPAMALPVTDIWISFFIFTTIYTLGFLAMAGALFRALLVSE